MKTIIINVNDATQQLTQYIEVTGDGKPTIIQAQDKVNYELLEQDIGYAPHHIVTSRVDDNLHISFEKDSDVTDLIIRDYFDQSEVYLIGKAENNQFYNFIPDTGEYSDYVSELQVGDVEGQALGDEGYPAPWWMGVGQENGVGVVPILGGLAGLGLLAGGALTDEDEDPEPTSPPPAPSTDLDISAMISNDEGGSAITGIAKDSQGSGLSGVSISIQLADGTELTGQSDEQGGFNIQLPDTVVDGSELTIMGEIDNTIAEAQIIVIRPDVNETGTVVTGNAPAGSVVSIDIDGDGTEDMQTQVDTTGTYQFDLTNMANTVTQSTVITVSNPATGAVSSAVIEATPSTSIDSDWRLHVDTGAGENIITVGKELSGDDEILDTVLIAMGGGSDRLTIETGDIINARIAMDQSLEQVAISKSPTMPSELTTASDADLNDGDDYLKIEGNIGNNVYIYMGAGNDTAHISGLVNIDNSDNGQDAVLNMGSGNDVVLYSASDIDGFIFGGAGEDTLRYDSVEKQTLFSDDMQEFEIIDMAGNGVNTDTFTVVSTDDIVANANTDNVVLIQGDSADVVDFSQVGLVSSQQLQLRDANTNLVTDLGDGRYQIDDGNNTLVQGTTTGGNTEYNIVGADGTVTSEAYSGNIYQALESTTNTGYYWMVDVDIQNIII